MLFFQSLTANRTIVIVLNAKDEIEWRIVPNTYSEVEYTKYNAQAACHSYSYHAVLYFKYYLYILCWAHSLCL